MGEYRPKYEKEWPEIIAAGTRNNLDNEEMVWLLAMREVESGGQGNQFGEMPVKGTDLDTQAGWAAAGIKKNRQRYFQFLRDGVFEGGRRTVKLEDFKEPPDVFTFMAQYAAPTGYGRTPIHAPELTKKHVEMNIPWPKNMKSVTENIQKYIETKGINYTK